MRSERHGVRLAGGGDVVRVTGEVRGGSIGGFDAEFHQLAVDRNV
jgi:hypothetical protein